MSLCLIVFPFVFIYLRGERPIDVVPSDGKEVNNTIKEMLQTNMTESLEKEVKKV